MAPSIFVDDADVTNIIYGGTEWTHETKQSSAFNGTLTTLSTKNQNTTLEPLSFFVYFYGVDFNIYGIGKNGVSLNYSLDDSTTMQTAVANSGGGTGKNGIDIWNIGGLSQTAFHSLKVIPTGGSFNLDYITYTPDASTTLSGQKLIVDDADSSVQLSGNWNKTSGDFPIGVPYKGTMTGTHQQGANVTFPFVGSSISVFGLLNQQPGKLSVLFSIDGGSTTAYTPFDGTQSTNASAWTLSQQFFHQDVQAGSHTLAIQVNEVTQAQTFWLDSIVYQATSATQLSTTSSGGGGKGLSSGGITGIVIGAIVILSLLGCCTQKEKVRRVTGFTTTTTTTTFW